MGRTPPTHQDFCFTGSKGFTGFTFSSHLLLGSSNWGRNKVSPLCAMAMEAADAAPGEGLLSLMRALPTPQADDEERYPLGRDLITYQSPRQKRARLEARLELDVEATELGFQSPKRHRAPKALQSSPRVTRLALSICTNPMSHKGVSKIQPK